MTKQELILALKVLVGIDDEEYCHQEADDLLIKYINDPDITSIYNKINKWYS